MTTSVIEETERLMSELEAQATDLELLEAERGIFAYSSTCACTDSCACGTGGGPGPISTKTCSD
jgi:hypothetical protein